MFIYVLCVCDKPSIIIIIIIYVLLYILPCETRGSSPRPPALTTDKQVAYLVICGEHKYVTCLHIITR